MRDKETELLHKSIEHLVSFFCSRNMNLSKLPTAAAQLSTHASRIDTMHSSSSKATRVVTAELITSSLLSLRPQCMD
jgi:hypothetical protein